MAGNVGQELHASVIKDHQYIAWITNLTRQAELLCNQTVILFRHSSETLLHFMENDTTEHTEFWRKKQACYKNKCEIKKSEIIQFN